MTTVYFEGIFHRRPLVQWDRFWESNINDFESGYVPQAHGGSHVLDCSMIYVEEQSTLVPRASMNEKGNILHRVQQNPFLRNIPKGRSKYSSLILSRDGETSNISTVVV